MVGQMPPLGTGGHWNPRPMSGGHRPTLGVGPVIPSWGYVRMCHSLSQQSSFATSRVIIPVQLPASFSALNWPAGSRSCGGLLACRSAACPRSPWPEEAVYWTTSSACRWPVAELVRVGPERATAGLRDTVSRPDRGFLAVPHQGETVSVGDPARSRIVARINGPSCRGQAVFSFFVIVAVQDRPVRQAVNTLPIGVATMQYRAILAPPLSAAGGPGESILLEPTARPDGGSAPGRARWVRRWCRNKVAFVDWKPGRCRRCSKRRPGSTGSWSRVEARVGVVVAVLSVSATRDVQP